MKNISHKGKVTRKNNKHSKSVKKSFSIPEIKQAFDSLERETHRILQKGETVSSQVKEFQKVFKSIFHHPVSTESAEGYLSVKRLLASKKGSRKTRKMKGGAAALAGAPLDSITQPGINGVHGSFPAYQSQGLAFYDTINKEGMYQECGIKDITPHIGSSMGSNGTQSGGKLSDVVHLSEYNPIQSSSPPSSLQGAINSLKGFPPAPSSDPTNNPRITL